MKFRVHLGWKETYLFDSADEAMRFAITAKVEREDSEVAHVEIELISMAEILNVGDDEEATDD